MNDKIRLGLFAASAIAALSLSACKTTDEAAQDSAPPAAEAAPAPTDAVKTQTVASPEEGGAVSRAPMAATGSPSFRRSSEPALILSAITGVF